MKFSIPNRPYQFEPFHITVESREELAILAGYFALTGRQHTDALLKIFGLQPKSINVMPIYNTLIELAKERGAPADIEDRLCKAELSINLGDHK